MLRLVLRVILLIMLTTVPSLVAQADEAATQRIIVTGVGDSVEAAAQNAAENALTQVVGSFIDTDTLLKKQTQIEDGVKKQTKEISTQTREYSQGSIRKFEVVKAKQEGGLYKVTADVEVRIEDFKAYIKKVAEGSVDVDEGLFAELATEKNNTSDKRELLIDTIITPLVKSEVVQFVVSKPISIKNAINSDDPFLKNFSERIGETGLVPGETFVVPINVNIDPAFWENMVTKIESIADQKVTDKSSANSPCYELQHNLKDSQRASRAYIAIQKNGWVIDCYGIDNIRVNRNPSDIPSNSTEMLRRAIERGLGFDSYGGTMDMRPLMPDLLVSFVGGSGNSISEHLVSRNNANSMGYPSDDASHPAVVTSGGWSGISGLERGGQGILYIPRSYPRPIAVSLPIDQLKDVKSINIKVVSR